MEFYENKIPIPSASNCRGVLGTDSDPYDVALCDSAMAIEDHPDGPEAQRCRDAKSALASGDFRRQDIP